MAITTGDPRHFLRKNPNYLKEALKELYSFILDAPDQALFNLIGRYKDKVSERLLLKYDQLNKLGKDTADDTWKSVIYGQNPLLSLVDKSHGGFVGKYFPVPITVQNPGSSASVTRIEGYSLATPPRKTFKDAWKGIKK